MRIRKMIGIIFILSIAIQFSSCEDLVKHFYVLPISDTIKVFEKSQIHGYEMTEEDKNISWKSSDTSVASIDMKVVFSGLKIGAATLTGTTPPGKTDSFEITIIKHEKARVAKYELSDDESCSINGQILENGNILNSINHVKIVRSSFGIYFSMLTLSKNVTESTIEYSLAYTFQNMNSYDATYLSDRDTLKFSF